MSLIIYNANIITNEDRKVVKNGAIYVENDEIRDIDMSETILSKYESVDRKIDAESRVVMPGFICSHMHFYSAFATGMPLPPFPKGFHNVLKHLWWKIDRALNHEDIYYSALLGYIQAVKSGTTTVIDHHASPSQINGSLDLIEKAGREVGVRSNLCYEVTDRNGHEGAIEGLKENKRYLQKVKNGDDMFSGSLGLHASFTLDPETLASSREILDQYNSGVHIHVAEGRVDMNHSKSNFGKTVIERLEDHGLLNEKSMLAHCIHLDDVDYPILKKRNVNISHQPRSNMNNAVGVINLDKLKEYKIPFGMGTDGMSSDMKPELMVGSLLQKHHKQDNTFGTIEMYNALMKQNPKIIKKITGVETGILKNGYKADIIISDYRPKTPINSDNIVGHVMFGVINETINSTIINGKIRMLNHKLDDIDEVTINQKSRELAEKVWSRVKNL